MLEIRFANHAGVAVGAAQRVSDAILLHADDGKAASREMVRRGATHAPQTQHHDVGVHGAIVEWPFGRHNLGRNSGVTPKKTYFVIGGDPSSERFTGTVSQRCCADVRGKSARECLRRTE